MIIKVYKTKIKQDFAHDFKKQIDRIIEATPVDGDDDKLWFAGLAEISYLLGQKLADGKHEFTIKLTAVQAFSLRILVTSYFTNNAASYTSWLGNKLLQLSNDIHKHFNI